MNHSPHDSDQSAAGSDPSWELGDLDQVVKRYQSGLLHYAQQWCRRFSLSCEVVQETFARLVQHAHQSGTFESESHLKAWLYRVCRQRAIDLHRKEQRMTTSLETDSVPDPRWNDPANRIALQDTHDQIQQQLARLSDNQQEVVRLKFQAGLSYKEIAEVTGLTVTNVGYLLHTALSTLKERISTA